MSEKVEYYFVTDYQLDRLKREIAKLLRLSSQAVDIEPTDLIHLRETIDAISFQTRELLED